MKDLFSELFLSKSVNYFDDDVPLKAILKYHGFNQDSRINDLGRYVSDELVELLDHIDHYAKPVLQTWTLNGKRMDYVRLSPAHSEALKKLQDFGVVSSIFSGKTSMLNHFITGYVISDSGIFCTMTLTAQTAYAIWKYADESLRRSFLPRFLDAKEPWYGATFYTETQGGSDLGSNSTSAARNGDTFLLSGTDKYFASNAGIADAAIVTARVEGSREGARGISVFLVPALRKDGSPNYGIRRLKEKMGTVAVPTGEVELDGAEAYLLGTEEQGIYIAMEILIISRIDDAIAALGIARKALWEAYLYACRRTAFGRRLIEHPLMLRDFLELEAELQGALALTVYASEKFDSVLEDRPPYGQDYQQARILSNIAKNMASIASAEITRYAMEMLGGIGFLEEFPIAKFHRDSIVTSIWEGTSNIQALEFLEVIAKKGGGRPLLDEIGRTIELIGQKETRDKLNESLLSLSADLDSMLKSDSPEFYAKDALTKTGMLISASRLSAVGSSGSEESGLIQKASRIYLAMHFGKGISHKDAEECRGTVEWMGEHLKQD